MFIKLFFLLHSLIVTNSINRIYTFGARVAIESSWACAFTLADPSKIEGSSWIRSLDPTYYHRSTFQSCLLTSDSNALRKTVYNVEY